MCQENLANLKKNTWRLDKVLTGDIDNNWQRNSQKNWLAEGEKARNTKNFDFQIYKLALFYIFLHPLLPHPPQ